MLPFFFPRLLSLKGVLMLIKTVAVAGHAATIVAEEMASEEEEGIFV